MIRRYGRHAWLAILITTLPQVCTAQAETQIESRPVRLETITILGTRTEKSPDQVPRSIDVIEQDQIAHEQSTDLGGIVDVLPNVSLNGSPRSMGETISIRGISGKRILLLIDGIEQDYGAGHVSGGFIPPGLIKSVEVERGPASVLWGSGALGGVVSIETKDATDLLADGQDIGARLHGGYQSATDGWITGGAAYGRLGDSVDALFHLGRSDFGNLKLGNDETLAHSGYQRTSFLAKGTWHITPGHSLQLSHRRSWLNAVSPSNPSSRVSRENPLVEREIAVGASRIEWRLLPESLKLVDLTVGLSHIRTEVDASEVRSAEYENTAIASYGLDAANTSRFDLGAVGRHVLTYGFDADRESIEATENGHPSKSTPNAHQLIAGVFIQDETHWSEAWITTLGLRFDHYRSESDAGVAPDQHDGAMSLQAGLLWQATDWLQLYASYAEAFRAPSVTEMYKSGLHFLGNKFVPNPNLKPEEAANKEVGLRAEWEDLFASRDSLRIDLAVFRNDVENYIQTTVHAVNLSHPPWVAGTTRIDNVHDARLEGFEVKASYTTDIWFVGMSYGQTRGYNETKDQPLADIAADTWVVRAGITALPWDGRITWRMTHAEPQNRVPPGVKSTDSYTVHDLLTTWHPTSRLRLDLGIGNITDRAYRRHNSSIQEAGRNFKFGVTVKF